jgi:GT2 family glycosyltransferase
MTDAAGDLGSAWPEPVVQRGSRVPGEPGLSICLLVLERARLALACLDSLRQPGACPPGTEFVVVANGTPSDQLESLVVHDDLVVVVNQQNLGFPAGCNQAASVARAPLLVFLNDDSTVEIGCIDALKRAASEDPTVGAVGARILSVDGALEEAGSVIWRDGSTAHVGEGLPRGSDAYLEPRDVDYASANGLLVSRRAWDVVGGFDERFYPAYFEDVDLCLTLAAHGFRTRYEPQARIVHRGSQSSSNLYREFLLNRNQRKLVEKWGSILDRFEPPPPKDSGPVFDAAVQRAIERGAAGATTPHLEPRSIAHDDSCARDIADPSRAAETVRAEYQVYLEQRVADRDQRVMTLETYLSRLWGVQLRRWVGGRLDRGRG